jgi:hypothetical protein
MHSCTIQRRGGKARGGEIRGRSSNEGRNTTRPGSSSSVAVDNGSAETTATHTLPPCRNSLATGFAIHLSRIRLLFRLSSTSLGGGQMQAKFIQAGPSKILRIRKKQKKKFVKNLETRNKTGNNKLKYFGALKRGVGVVLKPFLFPIAQRSDDGTRQNLGGRRVGEKLRNSEEINQEVRERSYTSALAGVESSPTRTNPAPRTAQDSKDFT